MFAVHEECSKVPKCGADVFVRRRVGNVQGGGGAMPVAGLQPCDCSKITLISTTQPQEGGFGKSQNLEFVGGVTVARLQRGVASPLV
jgi:hypothetical protein